VFGIKGFIVGSSTQNRSLVVADRLRTGDIHNLVDLTLKALEKVGEHPIEAILDTGAHRHITKL